MLMTRMGVSKLTGTMTAFRTTTNKIKGGLMKDRWCNETRASPACRDGIKHTMKGARGAIGANDLHYLQPLLLPRRCKDDCLMITSVENAGIIQYLRHVNRIRCVGKEHGNGQRDIIKCVGLHGSEL